MTAPRAYDLIMLGDELDMLECRSASSRTGLPHVLVECPDDASRGPKPLHYAENGAVRPW